MNNYFERNISMTPDFLRRVNDRNPYMYEHLNREEDLYTGAYTTPFYKHEAREEKEFFHKTCQKLSQSGHENDIGLYDDEFTWLILQMEKSMPTEYTEKTLRKLLQLSELADGALCEANQSYDSELGSSYYGQTPSMINITDLINWQQRQERNGLLFMLQEQAIHRDEDLFLVDAWNRKPKGLDHPENAMPEKKPKPKPKPKRNAYKAEPKSTEVAKSRGEKKPECWHFMRGHCKRGKYCDFSHDSKSGYPDSCKVFLGGLPFQITEASLKQKLLEKGFNVVNKPQVYGGFCPQVCLANPAEAKRLIEERTIIIEGNDVDIRPYQAFTKKNQDKLLDVSRRSVFLGGLRKGTTTQMIKKELESLGLKIVNYPLVKAGFSPQVTMATAEQALKLVSMVKVSINGTMVDIRPSRPYTAFGRVT